MGRDKSPVPRALILMAAQQVWAEKQDGKCCFLRERRRTTSSAVAGCSLMRFAMSTPIGGRPIGLPLLVRACTSLNPAMPAFTRDWIMEHSTRRTSGCAGGTNVSDFARWTPRTIASRWKTMWCHFDAAQGHEPTATRRMDGTIWQGVHAIFGRKSARLSSRTTRVTSSRARCARSAEEARIGLSATTMRTGTVRNYIAIAEPSDDGQTWWISFPGLPGITSAADRPEQIAAQARMRWPAPSMPARRCRRPSRMELSRPLTWPTTTAR